jgi:hypothetical protein
MASGRFAVINPRHSRFFSRKKHKLNEIPLLAMQNTGDVDQYKIPFPED